MNAVGPNILIDLNDPRDPAKQRAAAALVSGLLDSVLLWPVACEYLAASYQHEDRTKYRPIGRFAFYGKGGMWRSLLGTNWG